MDEGNEENNMHMFHVCTKTPEIFEFDTFSPCQVCFLHLLEGTADILLSAWTQSY